MSRFLWCVMVLATLRGQAQVRSLASVLQDRAAGLQGGGAGVTVRAADSVAGDGDVSAAQSVEAALHQMHDAAATVFSGEVAAIRREEGAVAIDWRVDEAIRGVAEGQIFTAREWAGLWRDQPRYVVGQRSLVMLHAASVAGYCAPVPDGVLPVRGDAVTGTVDLRWVMTHVQRAASQPGGGVAGVQTLHQVMRSRAASMQSARSVAQASNATGDAEQDGSAVERSIVSGMLRTWQMQREAALRAKQDAR